MIEQIGAARAIVEDGAEVVPARRINTPEDSYLIFTRFDHDKSERVLLLISRFMTWKMATSFVLTAVTWLGADEAREGEEALLAIGVSHHERLGLVQRMLRRRTFGCCPAAPAQSSEAMASWQRSGSARLNDVFQPDAYRQRIPQRCGLPRRRSKREGAAK
jgi:hypothetical protein